MDYPADKTAKTKIAAGKAVLFPLLWYVLIAFGMSVLWILGKRGLASVFPEDTYVAFWNFLDRNESVLEMLLISAPAIFLYLHLYRRDRREKEGEAEKKGLPSLGTLVLSAACIAIGLNVLLQMSPLFTWFPAYSEESAKLTGGSMVLYLAYLVIIAPLTEELLFRGLVFRRLRRAFGLTASMVASALLFGAFHANMVQFIYAFLVGLLLAAVTEWYQDLAAPFLFHGAANLSGGFSGLLLRQDAFSALFWGSLFTGAGLLFLWMTFHKVGKARREEKDGEERKDQISFLKKLEENL